MNDYRTTECDRWTSIARTTRGDGGASKRRAVCGWTQHSIDRAASLDLWIIGLFFLLAVAGCARRAPQEYVSSEAVQSLEAPLQDTVRGELATWTGTHGAPKLLGATEAKQDDLQLGQQVYERYCLPCHGVSGDGAGPAAAYLSPRPRDYRRGVFKFTSTPYGNKPRREDLVRTVTRGIPGTSMPSFSRLPRHELEAVVDYVLTLTHRGELEQLLAAQAEAEGELDPETVQALARNILNQWREAQDNVVEPASKMPPMTAESIAQGAEIFQKRECYKCHGRDGRGGLAGGIEVGVDAWGHKTAAADLTSGMLHGGQQPLDVYRRIDSGINGTPMPAFKTVFAAEPDDIWHLAHYVLDLADQRRRGVAFPPAAGAIPPTSATPETTDSQPAEPEKLP